MKKIVISIMTIVIVIGTLFIIQFSNDYISPKADEIVYFSYKTNEINSVTPTDELKDIIDDYDEPFIYSPYMSKVNFRFYSVMSKSYYSNVRIIKTLSDYSSFVEEKEGYYSELTTYINENYYDKAIVQNEKYESYENKINELETKINNIYTFEECVIFCDGLDNDFDSQLDVLKNDMDGVKKIENPDEYKDIIVNDENFDSVITNLLSLENNEERLSMIEEELSELETDVSLYEE